MSKRVGAEGCFGVLWWNISTFGGGGTWLVGLAAGAGGRHVTAAQTGKGRPPGLEQPQDRPRPITNASSRGGTWMQSDCAVLARRKPGLRRNGRKWVGRAFPRPQATCGTDFNIKHALCVSCYSTKTKSCKDKAHSLSTKTKKRLRQSTLALNKNKKAFKTKHTRSQFPR